MSMQTTRRAKPADGCDIERLYRQLVGHDQVHVDPAHIAHLEADSRSALFVVERDGVVFATALVNICLDVMFGSQPFAVIENFVVSTAFQGQGMGSRLLREVETFCLSQDCTKMMLSSSVHRSKAHTFFEHCGFSSGKKKTFVKYRVSFNQKPITNI